jgi:hypothetical protein
LLTIENVNSEDVVDSVTHPNPDARLLMGPRGYAELEALTSAESGLRQAA